ncbi:hypothetical protein JCM8547_004757 [Rhodosporidiobolus lusitaniae]
MPLPQTNSDPSFHHQPVDGSVPAPTTTTTHTTASTVPPPQPAPTHTTPAVAHDTPNAGPTPASTTTNADPSVASNEKNAAKTEGVEGESTAGQTGGGYDYPPQLHAGKVGLGPHYNAGGGLGDKLKGKEEQIKGKLTKNPDLVEHGKELADGSLARKERESDLADGFTRPDDGATQGNNEGGPLREKGTTASDVRESGHAASASAGTAGTKSA